MCLLQHAWESAPVASSQWTLPVNKCMNLWLRVCVAWQRGFSVLSMENISVMPPQNPSAAPPSALPPTCLIQSINTSSFSLLVSHCISSPASTTPTRHNRPGFGFPLKRQRASKSITAFLIFIDPKAHKPPLYHTSPLLPNITDPHISLRGIDYSEEGDCAEKSCDHYPFIRSIMEKWTGQNSGKFGEMSKGEPGYTKTGCTWYSFMRC